MTKDESLLKVGFHRRDFQVKPYKKWYQLNWRCNRGCAINHRSTRNKGIEQACYPVTRTIQNNTVLEL